MMGRTLSIGILAGVSAAACTPGGSAPTMVNKMSSSSGGASGSSSGAVGSSSGVTPTPNGGQFTVTMQNSGRHGDDVVFSIQGSDPAGKTTEAHVKLVDPTGMPVIAFDTNWDGVTDSAEQRVHFDTSTLGQTTFQTTITLSHALSNAPRIGGASVALSDVHGTLSTAANVTLSQQPVRKLGEGCDPTSVADRCADGLSCSGATPACAAGTAPVLTRVGYYSGDNPSELILGSDPDEDLASLEVDFLDANSKAVIVDLSGDGTPASSILLDAHGVPGQTFFYENDPVSAFTTQVPKISVKATDAEGRTGTAMTATLSVQPVIAIGLSCDPYGFTTCAKGAACSPSIPGATNECTSLSPLQAAKNNAAPLAMSDGLLAAWAPVTGVSLWDPPTGCSAATAVGRPESLVTLQLGASANTLTISTATPETDFDTVLYVLPNATTDSSAALGCNDDTQGFTSTVTLTNVSAGTYLVVVDSAGPRGGHFGLTVSAR
ncbi:MAG TPA: hypothetical protein VGM06_09100 [Polyangiaceae bacterium]